MCEAMVVLTVLAAVDVENATRVAKGISDYGMMAITAAFFLTLSAAMMIALFKWFKSLIERMLEQQETLRQLLDTMEDTNSSMRHIAERLEPDTKLRIRNLTSFAFDLSVEQVCQLIKRIRKENHIANKKATAEKIRKALRYLHDNRNSKFEPFTYRGKPLSEYCCERWIEDVAKVVEGEIYHEDGENDSRAYNNVKLAYDNIRTDFYQRMTSK